MCQSQQDSTPALLTFSNDAGQVKMATRGTLKRDLFVDHYVMVIGVKSLSPMGTKSTYWTESLSKKCERSCDGLMF